MNGQNIQNIDISDIKNKILKLKRENDICILAHSYQTRDICDVADYTGDSFGLSINAAKTNSKTLLMCGVRFMAETAKMLSPRKKVILANPHAGCPMADNLTKEDVLKAKKLHPGYAVACYINTTAEVKTVCDVCVTSSSAVKILANYDSDSFIFVPDKNLGSYVQAKLPNKNFVFVEGCCPIHNALTKEIALSAKQAHPDALFLVHPECRPEIVEIADYIGSTTGIMDFARKSGATKFLIATENEIASHLGDEMPEKEFISPSPLLYCPNMKRTSIEDVFAAVSGNGGLEIDLDGDTIRKAVNCINEMIKFG